MSAHLVLVPFGPGPAAEQGKEAGWLQLVDDDGNPLWTAWTCPMPAEVWAVLGETVRATQKPVGS